MNVVFVSNFLNHHQIAFCEYLNAHSSHFAFIETTRMPYEVKNIGYTNYSDRKYVFQAYENEEKLSKSYEIVRNADVAILGACSGEYLKIRMEFNRLTFVFSERLWKKGTYRRFIPKIHKTIEEKYLRNKDKNLYVLCASSFLAYDLSLVGFPIEKCLKWGYFPPTDQTPYSILKTMKPDKIRILWVGRFIPLKRAKDIIIVANRLKKNGYLFDLDFIGSGGMMESYQKYVRKYQLQDCVHFLGNIPAETVREEMKRATFLSFNSDFREGWGAVVNEAMNSACVPVVSHAVGSVESLIKDGENGYIYRMGNRNDLYRAITFAIDTNKISECAEQAEDTIVTCWNAENAGERLLKYVDALLFEKELPCFFEGPCSKAKIISNNWYRWKR